MKQLIALLKKPHFEVLGCLQRFWEHSKSTELMISTAFWLALVVFLFLFCVISFFSFPCLLLFLPLLLKSSFLFCSHWFLHNIRFLFLSLWKNQHQWALCLKEIYTNRYVSMLKQGGLYLIWMGINLGNKPTPELVFFTCTSGTGRNSPRRFLNCLRWNLWWWRRIWLS